MPHLWGSVRPAKQGEPGRLSQHGFYRIRGRGDDGIDLCAGDAEGRGKAGDVALGHGAGDHAAFRIIVEHFAPGLHRLARGLVGSADAQDMVQDTFCRAHRRMDSFDSRYRMSTWLYGICLNRCRDFLKSARRREVPTADPQPEGWVAAVDEQTDLRATLRRVERAMGQMRPRDREILVLKDFEQLSYTEVREVLGAISISALKVRVIRARARLRELMR